MRNGQNSFVRNGFLVLKFYGNKYYSRCFWSHRFGDRLSFGLFDAPDFG